LADVIMVCGVYCPDIRLGMLNATWWRNGLRFVVLIGGSHEIEVLLLGSFLKHARAFDVGLLGFIDAPLRKKDILLALASIGMLFSKAHRWSLRILTSLYRLSFHNVDRL
jgi:hypothetical protein